MKRRLAVVGGAALLLAASISGPAWGWWAGGHGIISRAAVMSLPDEVPTFFRSGRKMVGHMSFDPDVSKNRGTPHVSAAEHGEHYLDLELMKGRDLPDSRQAFIALCYELGEARKRRLCSIRARLVDRASGRGLRRAPEMAGQPVHSAEVSGLRRLSGSLCPGSLPAAACDDSFQREEAGGWKAVVSGNS